MGPEDGRYCPLSVLLHVGSKNTSLLDRAQDAVYVYGLGEIFQVFAAESLHLIAITQAAEGLWTNQELTGLGSGGQARRQVGDWTARRKSPAGPLCTLEAGRTDQGEPRVQTHMDSQ